MLCVSQQATSRLILRGKQWFFDESDRSGVVSAVHMRELMRPSPVVSSTRDLGKSAHRQEQLLDVLEQRMLQRANELADIKRYMSSGSFLPIKPMKNKFDQWECRYLADHRVIVDPVSDECLPDGYHMEPKRNPRVPDTAYRPKNAAAYCASDPATCGVTDKCCGCRG